jgi:hypothetical protein
MIAVMATLALGSIEGALREACARKCRVDTGRRN